MDMNWLEIAKTMGPTLTVIVIWTAFLAKGMQWFGDNVVKPLVDQHIDFLKITAASIRRNEESLDRISQTLEKLAAVEKH